MYTLKTFEGITHIITGKRSASELGGPIMIASVASNAADKGLESYLFIMAIISINLRLNKSFSYSFIRWRTFIIIWCSGSILRLKLMI